MQKPGWVRGKFTEAVFNRLQEKPKNRKLAIQAKCLDCCCGDRLEVARCQIKGCALWAIRPYQKTKAAQESECIENETD